MAVMTAIRTDKEQVNKEHQLGQRYVDSNGRVWTYCKAGATGLDRGKLTAAPTVVANHTNMSWQTAPAAGDKVVKVTLGATAATADQYKDGWLVVNDGTGEGRMYPVEGNLAADSAATCTVYLAEAIDTAGALAEANVDLLAGKYNGVVISPADQADAPVCVPIVAITADYYFWAQSGGPCAVWADETLTPVAGLVTMGSSVPGSVEELDATAEPLVGEVMQQAGVDTEYPAINLLIDTPFSN